MTRLKLFLGACFLNLTIAGYGAAPELRIGAIPDQDPEKVARLNGLLGSWLEDKLQTKVTFVPVIDYAAAVTAFRVGDLDLVWFGGLTGVQARRFVPGARAIIQRDIDRKFHSVFIASSGSGLRPISAQKDLKVLKGKRFTFGSQSSTSGRLMPRFFLEEAGVSPKDFAGRPGFSGSHDKTLRLVESGTYEAGVLNEQVWLARLQSGKVDTKKVRVIWRTPPYFDYHWVLHPQVKERLGPGADEKIRQAFLDLDPARAPDKKILDLFGAKKFIPTGNANYAAIEKIGISLGMVKKL